MTRRRANELTPRAICTIVQIAFVKYCRFFFNMYFYWFVMVFTLKIVINFLFEWKRIFLLYYWKIVVTLSILFDTPTLKQCFESSHVFHSIKTIITQFKVIQRHIHSTSHLTFSSWQSQITISSDFLSRHARSAYRESLIESIVSW